MIFFFSGRDYGRRGIEEMEESEVEEKTKVVVFFNMVGFRYL